MRGADKKVVVSDANLQPTMSIDEFVIKRLLDGIHVHVKIDDVDYVGYVTEIIIAKGYNYVNATVFVPERSDESSGGYVKVSIGSDGKVKVLPDECYDVGE